MHTNESESCCDSRNIPVIVAVVCACLIFVGLVWATKRYTAPAPLGAARAAERAKARAELTAAESEALNTVGYVDPVRGTVRLPISEAMKLSETQWQDPAKGRAELLKRFEKSTAKIANPYE